VCHQIECIAFLVWLILCFISVILSLNWSIFVPKLVHSVHGFISFISSPPSNFKIYFPSPKHKYLVFSKFMESHHFLYSSFSFLAIYSMSSWSCANNTWSSAKLSEYTYVLWIGHFAWKGIVFYVLFAMCMYSFIVTVCMDLTVSDPMSYLVRHYYFPVPDAFPHVVRTLANR
jgi:hypothetical protein